MSDTPEKLEVKKEDKAPMPRSAENVQLDENALTEDKARQERAKEEQKERLGKTFLSVTSDGLKARGQHAENILNEVFKFPIRKLDKEWEARRNDLYARAQKGEKITYHDLMKATGEVEKQMQDAVGIITAYILEMAGKTKDGKLSEEALAEMIYSVDKSAAQVAELAMKQKETPQLVEAIQFALKTKKIEKSKVFETLSTTLVVNPNLSKFAWQTLSFMDEKLQVEFGQFHIEKNHFTPEDAQKFLDSWSKEGNISVDAMKKILINAKIDTTEFDKKAQEYATNWKVKNDFTKKAREMTEKSYGAVNQAGEMLQPISVIKAAAKIWAVGAIGMNLATAMFYGGKINSIGFILKSMLKNPPALIGSSILTGLSVAEKTGSVSEGLKSANDRKIEERKGAEKTLKLMFSNLELKAFFGSKETYESSEQFWAYMQYVRKEKRTTDNPYPPQFMTKGYFLEWLKETAKKETKPEKKTKIVEVIMSLEKAKISNEEFAKLTSPFDTLGIAGKNIKPYVNG